MGKEKNFNAFVIKQINQIAELLVKFSLDECKQNTVRNIKYSGLLIIILYLVNKDTLKYIKFSKSACSSNMTS